MSILPNVLPYNGSHTFRTKIYSVDYMVNDEIVFISHISVDHEHKNHNFCDKKPMLRDHIWGRVI